MWKDVYHTKNIIIETDGDNPVVVAFINGNDIRLANGYKLRVQGESDALVSNGDDIVRKKRDPFSAANFTINGMAAERERLQNADVAKD